MGQILTGAEILLESLIAEGVDTIFGYPGGQILSVYDKLYSYTDRLNHILVHPALVPPTSSPASPTR